MGPGWRRSLQQEFCNIRPAVPLRVGFVVFVPLVFDHPEAADADVRSGHLHPVQSDPARGGGDGRKGALASEQTTWERIRR